MMDDDGSGGCEANTAAGSNADGGAFTLATEVTVEGNSDGGGTSIDLFQSDEDIKVRLDII